MTNLQCSVMSCANNAQGCCCLPGIQVSGDHACDCGDTCCSSFQTKSSAMQNAVQYNQPNQTLEISCSAGTCQYNDHGGCTAHQVQVDGHDACQCYQTQCSTFQCK